MNIKTRKLLRNLVRQNPELLSVDPQEILDNHNNNKTLHVPVFLVEPEMPPEITPEHTEISNDKIDLESLDWNSILELAKTNNITNYRKMKKSDLISQLLELQNDGRLS
jgi:hypothetical protein